MNRLILIGNGFDLAHGLKTDYNSFIVGYLTRALTESINPDNNFRYDDGLIGVHCPTPPNFSNFATNIRSVHDLVMHFYNDSLKPLIDGETLFIDRGVGHRNPFRMTVRSPFIRFLLVNCNRAGWVDIENEFYNRLKEIVNSVRYNVEQIKTLNSTLGLLINQLNIYLSEISTISKVDGYDQIFNSKIFKDDIIGSRLHQDELPNEQLVLNFNYTGTAKKYLPPSEFMGQRNEFNYIHGELNDNNNPMIFGFGDELDDDYKKMEHSKENEFFEYIKSFWYFKTSNYHNLLRFLETTEYQIYVIGHSCGLSDRTLLHMLFEHDNCKSIKIYYHGDHKKNNFKRLTQEISRHFKDKEALRRKIVPFDRSEPMPQF